MPSPQRFLANHRNLIANALLTPSDVQAVDNAVIEDPIARQGTAGVEITGSYTGLDDASYDFEIVDDTADTKLVSSPVFSGVGSEQLTDIGVSSAAQQQFTLECAVPGTVALAAKVQIEGVNLVARAVGTSGNGIHITVDESDLVYTATTFSLLSDLAKEAGGEAAPLKGPEYDWQTATVGADDVIPLTAKRIAFDGDESNVYVQYKKFVDGDWQYFFVPAIQNDYPQGTKVKFVTGDRSVEITDGVTTDTLPAIVTVFDFLNLVKTASVLCDVEGVVADDRTPTGQSAHELNLHTNARHGYSYGTGSKVAKGFVDVTVDPASNTELITAECIGISFKDLPFAYLGHEAWQLNGSVSGDLGVIYTGVPVTEPTFGLTIPKRLPPSNGLPKGKFTMTDVAYAPREGSPVEQPPPICFKGALGPNAVDQTITLVYIPRPPADCDCNGMPFPNLNGPCLGTTGGGDVNVSYQTDTIERLKDLWSWYADTVRANSEFFDDVGSVKSGFEESFLTAPRTVSAATVDLRSLREVISLFQTVLASIDPLEAGSPSLRADGCNAWDTAFTELQGDIDPLEAEEIISIPAERYVSRLDSVLITAGLSPLGKADASILESGDGCWRDEGDDFFWTVVGSDGGSYAPYFTNHKYYSSRQAENNGKFYSTKEFAFQLNVKCPEDLRVGDTVTLVIGNSSVAGTYQVGDMLFLPLIAAQDLYLTGGRAASPVQTWYVTGSEEGAFAPYSFDPDTPAAYASGGVTFLLVMGGVLPGKGDKFVFAVVGGHYRWRKNGASWSSPIPIPDGAVVFDEGLSVEFVRGASPSFVADDLYSFRALQQWRASNLMRPNREVWYPGVSTASMEALFDAGSPPEPQPITILMIAYHTIPEGATIEVEGGDAYPTVDWTESLTWQQGVIVKAVELTGTFARLLVNGAPGATVGWWFAGEADAVSLTADATPKPNYKVSRGEAGGLYQGGVFLGKAINADVEWSEGALSEDDVVKLTAMIDHVKTHNDEPIVFLPNVTRPTDAFLAQIIEDEIPLPDVFGLQPNANVARRQSARLGLQGVWR